MPRPQRCRRICREPVANHFQSNENPENSSVALSLDEFEVLRLVDYENKTHEQCGALMDISRSTVTEIYESARHKLADALVNSKDITIGGGHYRLCDGSAAPLCGKQCCKASTSENKMIRAKKGDSIMKIAVTYENGEIFQHFGHSQAFKVYEIEDNAIVKAEVVDTNGSGHGALAGLLAVQGVDVLICGGIGGGAQMALKERGIRLFGGVRGNADEAVKALLEDRLVYNPEVRCGHHDHSHSCGEHSCATHKCHE